MAPHSSRPSWKWQLNALAIGFLGVTSAVPVADVDPTITEARVSQVQSSVNKQLGPACCTLLKIALGSIVSSPSSAAYESSTQSYWSSQTQAVNPWCIVSATNTADVSATVATLNVLRTFGLQCPFAIRSGGHTPWAGSATIDSGVTVSLAAINQVTVSSDQKTTSIGPGARWLDVYSKLDPLSLIVPGGRVATVGVGGLTTGGGISYFSGRYGFTADNVANYEIVLYDGSVVNANANTRSDLFFALKGGSNNFGVVTRFDLKTYSQGSFLGGSVVYPGTSKLDNLAAFVNFTGQANYDVNGALICSFAWSAASGLVVANFLMYTQPVLNPPVFQQFLAIQPQYVNTLRIANHSDFTLELAGSNPGNREQFFYTSTWGNDLALLTQILSIQDDYIQSVANVTGLSWSLSLQPLVTAITTRSASTGGNALGLNAADGNVVLSLVTASWQNSADDAAVTAAVIAFFAKVDALAASKGKLNPYKYLNYAYKTQQPIKGYGCTNVAKLRAASKKYDPAGVFQKLVPGGFKLF